MNAKKAKGSQSDKTEARSGTQAIAAQGDKGPVSVGKVDDMPVTAYSAGDAIKAFAGHMAASRHATFDAVCSGAIAYLAAAIFNAGGKKEIDEVTGKLNQFCVESGVKRSMSYDILAQCRSLALWLFKTHHLGGPVADIRSADTPVAALASLKAWLSQRNVNSFNTVKNMVNDTVYTDEMRAADEAAATPEGKAKAKSQRERAKTRNETKTTIATVIDRPNVLSQVVREATNREKLANIVVSFFSAINSLDALDECEEQLKARRAELKAELAAMPPEAKGRGTSATAH